MLVNDYSKAFYIDDKVALDYLKANASIPDDVIDPRVACKENYALKRMLLDVITEKVDVSVGGRNIEELLVLAEKYKLLFKGTSEYSVPMSPRQFAGEYNINYVTTNFEIVDYQDLRNDLAEKERKLADKISKLDSIHAERFEEGVEVGLRYAIKHIKPDYNFTDWDNRLQTIKESYWGYDEDFWYGSDHENSYDDELNSLTSAIKAQKEGKEKVVLEVCTFQDIKVFEFLVSELLSQERINLHYEDFEEFKANNPESFSKYITEDKDRNSLYEYLVAHHS